MKVVLIGAGNVAYHLGSLIQRNGHEIVQLYNRSKASGSKLALLFKCDFTNSIGSINSAADLYIVALKDDVIKNFCSKISFTPKLIVHTSGTCNIGVFPEKFNCGVLYPVQTFSKSIPAPAKIPFCIEARNKRSLADLRKFANDLSDTVHVKSSAEREKIHLAAVIVNNFTNHLFALSDQYLSKEQESFDILHPLIVETALKVQKASPEKIQTGPARRNDTAVIKEHKRLLKNHPGLKKIYNILTKSILNTYSKE
jgi:predicted short-subunit dehydrogenase-like oxidoreductase (DUF2520 family)